MFGVNCHVKNPQALNFESPMEELCEDINRELPSDIQCKSASFTADLSFPKLNSKLLNLEQTSTPRHDVGDAPWCVAYSSHYRPPSNRRCSTGVHNFDHAPSNKLGILPWISGK